MKSQVPGYIGAQVFAAVCAGFVLRLMFGDVAYIGATLPSGSDMQSFVLEIFETFLLMFVISAVATDIRAVDLYGISYSFTVITDTRSQLEWLERKVDN